MKRLLMFWGWLLLTVPLLAQSERTFTLNVNNQTSPLIDLRGTGVNLHKFTWSTVGTISAGACLLKGSVDNVTYGTTIISAQSVTSTGGPTALTSSGAVNYVKIFCAAGDGGTTLVGSGSVTFHYNGYLDGAVGPQPTNQSIPVTFPSDRCNLSAYYDSNTNGKKTVVAASGSTVIYVCGYSVLNSTGTAVTVSFGTGTGADCVTTYTAKTAAYVFPIEAAANLRGFIKPPVAQGQYFVTTAGENLCIQTNAAVSLQIDVVYSQY